MKIVAILVTLLAFSLAAPTDEVKAIEEKVAVPEKTVELVKKVEKVELASQSSSGSSLEGEKVEEAKVEEKVEEPDVKIPEEKAPVIVVATPVKEKDQETNDEVLSDEEKLHNYREYSEICRASTGATEEQIKAISKVVDDAPKAVKCYIKCMAEEYGFEKDNVVQKDVARKNKPSSVTDEEFDEVVETCGSLQTDDPCDSAYLRYSCYFRTSGEKIRLV